MERPIYRHNQQQTQEILILPEAPHTRPQGRNLSPQEVRDLKGIASCAQKQGDRMDANERQHLATWLCLKILGQPYFPMVLDIFLVKMVISSGKTLCFSHSVTI